MTMPLGPRLYAKLSWHGTAAGVDPFDLHVLAAILAIAATEASREGSALTQATGLDPNRLAALLATCFPGARHLLDGYRADPVEVAPDEASLREILAMHAAGPRALMPFLVPMVARRCRRPNHLWQDLGLGSRRELSALMRRYFPRLEQRNANDMKWKKFLYRMLCASTGYGLCTTPVCSECDDFEECFGAEDGEALLAGLRASDAAGEAVAQ